MGGQGVEDGGLQGRSSSFCFSLLVCLSVRPALIFFGRRFFDSAVCPVLSGDQLISSVFMVS